MVDDGQKRSRTGKRPEKTIAHEREKGGSINQDTVEDEIIKSTEPYVCTGSFHLDFRRLCAKSQMTEIPEVKPRPHRPTSPQAALVVEEKVKTGKVGKEKNQPHPTHEPESEVPSANDTSEPVEHPPKTYTTKDKFEYFKPCIQVEVEHVEKQDFVTEVYIRGWKIDVPMMNILSQCWAAQPRLQTICLWYTGLDDTTLQMLGTFTSSCSSLKTLILDNNPIKFEAWGLLLDENSSYQHLSLRYCNITDAGAESIGMAIGTTKKQNKKLLSLNLTGNKITDVGAEHLANGLRMNRTLLCLSLSSNLIGDVGAEKLAEVISKFPLTHEEIVMRRTLISSNADRKVVTPLLSGRKGDDRPGSVRSLVSSQAGGSKGKAGKGTSKKSEPKVGKEDDSKHHDKSKAGKAKDVEKGTKKDQTVRKNSSGASGSPLEIPKSSSKKTEGKKGRKKLSAAGPEISEGAENQSPLLDNIEHIGNGVLLLQGNLNLISLNLNNNKIGDKGIASILKALQYQTTMTQFQGVKVSAENSVSSVGKTLSLKDSTIGGSAGGKYAPKGLLRLTLQRNSVPMDSEDLRIIYTLMSTKDPLLKMDQRN